MLEKNLETCLNNSFKKAHADGHEFVTTEPVSYTHLTLPTK